MNNRRKPAVIIPTIVDQLLLTAKRVSQTALSSGSILEGNAMALQFKSNLDLAIQSAESFQDPIVLANEASQMARNDRDDSLGLVRDSLIQIRDYAYATRNGNRDAVGSLGFEVIASTSDSGAARVVIPTNTEKLLALADRVNTCVATHEDGLYSQFADELPTQIENATNSHNKAVMSRERWQLLISNRDQSAVAITEQLRNLRDLAFAIAGPRNYETVSTVGFVVESNKTQLQGSDPPCLPTQPAAQLQATAPSLPPGSTPAASMAGVDFSATIHDAAFDNIVASNECLNALGNYSQSCIVDKFGAGSDESNLADLAIAAGDASLGATFTPGDLAEARNIANEEFRPFAEPYPGYTVALPFTEVFRIWDVDPVNDFGQGHVPISDFEASVQTSLVTLEEFKALIRSRVGQPDGSIDPFERTDEAFKTATADGPSFSPCDGAFLASLNAVSEFADEEEVDENGNVIVVGVAEVQIDRLELTNPERTLFIRRLGDGTSERFVVYPNDSIRFVETVGPVQGHTIELRANRVDLDDLIQEYQDTSPELRTSFFTSTDAIAHLPADNQSDGDDTKVTLAEWKAVLEGIDGEDASRALPTFDTVETRQENALPPLSPLQYRAIAVSGCVERKDGELVVNVECVRKRFGDDSPELARLVAIAAQTGDDDCVPYDSFTEVENLPVVVGPLPGFFEPVQSGDNPPAPDGGPRWCSLGDGRWIRSNPHWQVGVYLPDDIVTDSQIVCYTHRAISLDPNEEPPFLPTHTSFPQPVIEAGGEDEFNFLLRSGCVYIDPTKAEPVVGESRNAYEQSAYLIDWDCVAVKHPELAVFGPNRDDNQFPYDGAAVPFQNQDGDFINPEYPILGNGPDGLEPVRVSSVELEYRYNTIDGSVNAGKLHSSNLNTWAEANGVDPDNFTPVDFAAAILAITGETAFSGQAFSEACLLPLPDGIGSADELVTNVGKVINHIVAATELTVDDFAPIANFYGNDEVILRQDRTDYLNDFKNAFENQTPFTDVQFFAAVDQTAAAPE